MAKPARKNLSASRRPVLMFLIKCLVFWGVALWIVSRFSFGEDTGVNLTVATVKTAVGLTGQRVFRSGSALTVGGSSVEIVADCSPHMPFLIFAAVILAFPSSWRQRLLGLL